MSSKIGFIGGGAMAEGILRGLLETDTRKPQEILVREILPERAAYLRETYGVSIAPGAQEAAEEADILVLAVRPQDARQVCQSLAPFLEAGRHVLVSICAGIRISQLSEWCGAQILYARIMPNTMIESRRGYSALAFSENAEASEKAEVQAITDAIGKTMPLDESLFDAFTASGCAGPEWLILFSAALIDAAVETGLSRKNAKEIVYENMIAAGTLLRSTSKHPFQLTDEMNTPGGIGIAGFHRFQNGNLHGTVMDAVNAAYKRTAELGA